MSVQREALINSSYHRTTIYLDNLESDPVISLRCIYDGKLLMRVKGAVVKIVNEETPPTVSISDNVTYLTTKCPTCKTDYFVLIYNIDIAGRAK